MNGNAFFLILLIAKELQQSTDNDFGCYSESSFLDYLPAIFKGQTIDNFRKATKVLGKGGFGEVYDCNLEKEPTVFKFSILEKPKHVRVFKNEARFLSVFSGYLNDPMPFIELGDRNPQNVEQIASYKRMGCTFEGKDRLPVPFLHGCYLNDKLKPKTGGMVIEKLGPTVSTQMNEIHLNWSDEERIDLYIEMAVNIFKVHYFGIAHNDIKSGNILLMLNSKKKVRLIDFGMSNYLGEQCSGGTSSHKAPENKFSTTGKFLCTPYLDEWSWVVTVMRIETKNAVSFKECEQKNYDSCMKKGLEVFRDYSKNRSSVFVATLSKGLEREPGQRMRMVRICEVMKGLTVQGNKGPMLPPRKIAKPAVQKSKAK